MYLRIGNAPLEDELTEQLPVMQVAPGHTGIGETGREGARG